MRYLKLSAQYRWPSVYDIAEGALSLEELGLSQELVIAIEDWNERYQFVIPKLFAEPRLLMKEINALDDEGIALAQKIRQELAPAKVQYCSEGLGKEIGWLQLSHIFTK